MNRPMHALAAAVAGALAFTALGLTLERLVRLAEPTRLIWLVVPALLLAAFCTWLVWRHGVEAALGARPTVQAMSASRSARLQVFRATAVIAAATLTVVALARPQWGEQNREVRRSGIDIVFALDISRSMLATDVAPSRIDAAIAEMERLMQRLDGDRVGLVVFAGIAFVQSPLTSDYGAIRLYLDRIHPDDLPVQGTAVGRAIHEAQKLLTGGDASDEFERASSQLIIVFSDGEDHVSEPEAAATAAAEAGIHVYTVGVGTPEGSRIPLHAADGTFTQFLADREGHTVVSKLEGEQLEATASAGGGSYVRLSGDGAAAATLERAIEEYADAELSTALRTQYQDRAWFFLAPAAVLTLLALGIGERRRGATLVATATAALVMAGPLGCGDSLMRPDPRARAAVDIAREGSGDTATDQALAELERVPEEGRALPQWDYARGWVNERGGRARDAQAAYLESLNMPDVPEQVAALFALGNALLAQEQYEAAIERYRRALTLDPTHEGARRNLEIALLRQFPPCGSLEDAGEDNDDAGHATALPASAFTGPYLPPGMQADPASTSPPEWIACGGDDDWYQVPVVGGSTLDIHVKLDRLRDDTGREDLPTQIAPTSVRVALLDVDGRTVLAADAGVPATPSALEMDTPALVDAGALERDVVDARISPTVDANGVAFLRVSVDSPLEYKYTIEVELTPPCWALEDQYESNDAPDVATAVESGNYDARICTTNDDWYALDAQPGDDVFVDLSPPQRDDGTPGSVQAQWVTGDEHAREVVSDQLGAFELRNITAPTHAALGVSSSDGSEGQYRVSIYHYGPCPDGNDRFEPNDDPTAAHALDLQNDPAPLRHLRLCESDVDWFGVPLPPTEEDDRDGQAKRPFSVLVTTEDPKRELLAAVYDPNTGAQLSVSRPIESADPRSAFGADGEHGVVAFAELPWELEGVLVVVTGDQPAFYDLDFPYTQQQQEQQQQQQDDQESQEGQDGEQQDDQQAQDQQDGEPQGGEQQPEESAEPSDDDAADDEAATPEAPTQEEADREALLRLLDSLEPDDVNLPLQQALEAAPPTRLQEEW
ncbi:MAG: VWA domain-containing protein [Myxococcales bacterium]|nr:VWA domain-containing protein [Myxococcales bacterium]MCB9532725.1 VWA domain-containing protein [Myxococcales bacterium]